MNIIIKVIWLYAGFVFVFGCQSNTKSLQQKATKLTEEAQSMLIAKDTTNALKKYDEAIMADSTHQAAYFQRANIRDDIGDIKGAMQDYTKFIELAPKSPSGYSFRGLLKERLGDFHGAMQDYNISIQLSPSAIEVYADRAGLKEKLGDKIGAISDYDKIIELDNKQAKYYNSRGMSRLGINNNDALKDFESALSVAKKGDAILLSGIALNIWSVIGDNSKAIKFLDKAIELDPKDTFNYNFRGDLYQELGKKGEACRDWSKAGEQGDLEVYEKIRKFCK
jgi:tetratricopeptide (TPR) repeat protein